MTPTLGLPASQYAFRQPQHSASRKLGEYVMRVRHPLITLALQLNPSLMAWHAISWQAPA
jgi:hypothetical protein